METNGKTKVNTIKIKKIFADHWDKFARVNLHKIPKDMVDSVTESVEKMLRCGDPKYGYIEYICLDCGKHRKIVGFSCKSRFCNRCGKVYIENWINKQVERIIDVSHRHTVFTIPVELRSKFYWHRDLLKDLSDGVAEVIQYWYRNKAKRKGYEVGIITTVHTFGRDMSFNPHVHALVTEGALDKHKNWKDVGYIPYEYLRKSWQKVLSDIIKNKFGQEPGIKKHITDLYHRYPKGFYVHAKTRMKDARGAAKYIGRYLARPAIAEYRIINYDGKNIKFWYIDHTDHKRKEKELDALEFIGKLIMHIPKKHFKMVRRYGLYRRDINKLAQKVVGLYNYIKTKISSKLKPRVTRKRAWKERLIQNFGKNPLICPSCKSEMELWIIWHPRYGYIYNAYTDLREVREENDGQKERDMGRRRSSVPRRFGGQSPSQLSLSELWL
jgi:hypothetical protein